eukprot:TRINITY_DN3769_c0_g1_i2.p2 TRINITY_DN3769_c0_g1~~TRINITY_DN3769_c0_g1_i2.p2  ORF type:complete len:309 (+),score=24.51 TRINITY_DN3769_c0_g1_i2:233-1159(+)
MTQIYDRYQPDVSLYIQPKPWLSLYGLRLGRKNEKVDSSAIKKALPMEVLRHVLGRLPPHSLAVLQCVSRYLRQAASQQELWQRACEQAFGEPMNTEEQTRIVRMYYGGLWKRMYIERPHVRFEGVYVARNTYIRRGQVEFHVHNPVHLVVYFRYIRFFPDGRVIYRTSPNPPDKVAKTMLHYPNLPLKKHDTLMVGRYRLKGNRLQVAALYAHSQRSELRMELRIRSTIPGANNRIDIVSITTYDGLDGSRANLLGDVEDEDDEGEVDGEGKIHRRGMAPCVFIAWEKVGQHVLNTPKEKMDYFIPG